MHNDRTREGKKETNVSGIFNGCSVPNHNYCCGNVFFGLSVELMFVVAIFFVGYIGKRCGFTYKEIKDGMIGCVAENAEMMVIMLGIGFVIGTWVFAGTVPVMIGWLAELISVKYVLVLSFVFCGIIAMIIGTSSATMGTIGVIMLGVATIQGINPGIAAAAVISGSFETMRKSL